MTVDEFIQAVRTGVAKLAERDPDRKIFAASSHGYSFKPVMPEDKLAAFEREHGFTLPADYRAFITQLGNGGPGPSYGTLGFQSGYRDDYTDYERLGEDWQYEDTYNPDHLLLEEKDDHELEDEDEDEDTANERYWNAFDRTGALYLCDHGCLSYSMLIVSGPCKGQVWYDEVGADAGFGPSTDANGNRHTFQTWYLEWLDKSLAETDA